MNKPVQQRRQPAQSRSQKRIGEIMKVAANLLDEVGLDDLTTILIAKRMNMSVGTLYHYFPNKQAILYAIAENWLKSYTAFLDEIEKMNLARTSLESFVEKMINLQLNVYRQQRGILLLMQAIDSIPELHDLDKQHDKECIQRLHCILQDLGFNQNSDELTRLSQLYLHLTHSLMLLYIQQKSGPNQNTLNDIKDLLLALLKKHF